MLQIHAKGGIDLILFERIDRSRGRKMQDIQGDSRRFPSEAI